MEQRSRHLRLVFDALSISNNHQSRNAKRGRRGDMAVWALSRSLLLKTAGEANRSEQCGGREGGQRQRKRVPG